MLVAHVARYPRPVKLRIDSSVAMIRELMRKQERIRTKELPDEDLAVIDPPVRTMKTVRLSDVNLIEALRRYERLAAENNLALVE